MTRDAIDCFIEDYSQNEEARREQAPPSDHERRALQRFEKLRAMTLDRVVKDAGDRLSAAGHDWIFCPAPGVPGRGQGPGMSFLFFPRGSERSKDLAEHFPRFVIAPMIDRGLLTVRLETEGWAHEEFVHYDIVTPGFVAQHLAQLCRQACEPARPSAPQTKSEPTFGDIFGRR